MNANEWLRHDYIPINPTGVTFCYDIVCSIATGNQFHLGWERFDSQKTSRQNDATVYVISTKPTSDIVKKRYQGTVNLSTDGVNPAAFIRLRILNAWTNTDASSTKKATVHSLSLREVRSDDVVSRKVLQTGQFFGDHFRENVSGFASISENGFIDGTSIYEY